MRPPTALAEFDRLAEFWTWFGQSRIVHPDGTPRTLYHGTGARFDSFDAAFAGQNFGVDREGFFFTTNTTHTIQRIGASEELSEDWYSAGAYAQHAAQRRGGAPSVIPVFLRLENPLTLDDCVFSFCHKDVASMIDGGHPQNYLDDYKRDIIILMKDEKRDGIAFEYGRDNVFVAFDPEQIRFALQYPTLYRAPERNEPPRPRPFTR